MRRFLPDTRGLPRAFWFLWAGTFVNRLGGFVAPFLAIYLTSVRGLSVQRAGLVVSLVGLGAIASGPVGGTLADRLGRRPTLALATLLAQPRSSRRRRSSSASRMTSTGQRSPP
jgi:MFS family permease